MRRSRLIAIAPKRSASKASSSEYCETPGTAGSAASAAKTSAARHVTTLLKHALPAEEAARPHDEDDDHDAEDRDRDPLRVHPEGEEGLGDADDQGGDDRAAHGAHAAEDDDDEREEDHLDPHLGVDREDGSQEQSRESGERGGAGEGQ